MTENKSSFKLSDVTKCPFCGGELERGYLTSEGWIQWENEDRFSLNDLAGLVIPHYTASSSYPALRCPGCLAIIFTMPQRGPHKTLKFLNTPNYLKKCPKCKSEIPREEEECEFCGELQPKER